MKVTIENLKLHYGKFNAIDDLSLSIGDGESVVLLGKSGCGKTSTMRCIAGLEVPTSGRITIGDTPMFDNVRGINVPPNKRNVGMVFQSYAVWPHLTVMQNVAYSLKVQKVPSDQIRTRVHEALELVGLAEFANRGASLLSGGQMQRVALARSLVMHPSVLMLDEPLSNLDARLRDRLRVELREIQLEKGLTTVYVTHDQSEALALADRIALMQGGRIVQIGSPTEIYAFPRTATIAHFLGVSNVFDCTAEQTSAGIAAHVEGTTSVVQTSDQRLLAAGPQQLCIRAEDITLSSEPVHDHNTWEGTVRVSSFQGSSIRYAVELTDHNELDVYVPARGSKHYEIGDTVHAYISPEAAQVLPKDLSADDATTEKAA
ncbi:MAG TPA: ABC transporter ATP-binding protein [Propionibacterium sp.]|jgi:iron(III) transport system ATP-binding protein|nr:ABC transporter ATP-binding protein [Propionibacterium sp.]